MGNGYRSSQDWLNNTIVTGRSMYNPCSSLHIFDSGFINSRNNFSAFSHFSSIPSEISPKTFLQPSAFLLYATKHFVRDLVAVFLHERELLLIINEHI